MSRILLLAVVLTSAACVAEDMDADPIYTSSDSQDLTGADAITSIGNRACFDWSCDSTTGTCTFDTGCSTINEGFVWRRQWSFGDGSTPVLVGSPTTSHTYGWQASATVTLDLLMFYSNTLPTITCGIQIRNVIGPPVPTYGRCVGYAQSALSPTPI